jgi:hypothetical protein
MTATTGSDATPPVQYFFQNTTTGMSSHNSGWQSSTSWTDTGLTAGTQYSYQVQARDSKATPNVGGWSTTASATTQGTVLLSDGFESGNFTTVCQNNMDRKGSQHRRQIQHTCQVCPQDGGLGFG